MSDWQPIETAPKDGTEVDLWVGGFRHPDCVFRGGWYDPFGYSDGNSSGAYLEGSPSHWMYAPPPPLTD